MRYVFIFFLAVVLTATSDTIARAEPAAPHRAKVAQIGPNEGPPIPAIVAQYDIYVGGAQFLSATILFHEDKQKYRAKLNAHTTGFWHRLFPWDSTLEAQGTLHDNHFVPLEYDNNNVWGKKQPKGTKLLFDPGGDVKVEFIPPKEEDADKKVPQDLRRGALDPISALLQMLKTLAVERNCNVTVPVYDGKLLFNITSYDVGTEYIDEEDYGVFKGTARTCDANFQIVDGKWANKVSGNFWKKSETEQGREPFHIWLGTVAANVPELPVRLETGSIWGGIVIHLSNWHYATSDELKP